MRKKDELTREHTCMQHAHPNEMTFVLLSRDAAAPIAIRAWVAERLRLGKNVETDEQIIEAQACAQTMELEGRQWVESATALMEVDRETRAHSCTCPHGDAREPLPNHDRACPIRVNRLKRIAPELVMQRLASALNNGDLVDGLQAALKEALRMAHPSTASSYTDDGRRSKCAELAKFL